jgi:RNA polymerase sigma-70 factor (ECF subfamily)
MNRFLAKARAGDSDAEEQLFRILRARFLRIAKRKIKGVQDAEDIVQKACLTVLEKYKAEESRGGFEAWVYTILRMKIGNYLQAMKTAQERIVDTTATTEPPTTAVSGPDWATERVLVDCLRKVTKAHPRYARVLNLAYQGYQADEICRRLRVTRSNLYSMLSRGRSMLSKCLETGRV